MSNIAYTESELFRRISSGGEKIDVQSIFEALDQAGILITDPRIRNSTEKLRLLGENSLNIDQFSDVVSDSVTLFYKVFTGDLIIPGFDAFRNSFSNSFSRISSNKEGYIGDYVPEMMTINPEFWGASVCTVDGQRINLGDSEQKFCLQSTCKPMNYCLALEMHGEQRVHEYVGREPSGLQFNEIALNKDNKPHNPMINSGAIMTCSLLSIHTGLENSYEYIQQKWYRCIGTDITLNRSMYLSEKESAFQNFALAYNMRNYNAFPKGVLIEDVLDLYFQCCSSEVTTETLSLYAAVLANGGAHPITGEKIFEERTVRNCLSLMSTCGMYDFSGEFAFSIGLPAKSGVSGAIILVVPGILGMVAWSPRLDQFGISTRGLALCQELANQYNWHSCATRVPPSPSNHLTTSKPASDANRVGPILWSAFQGDLVALKRLGALHGRLDFADYDFRTALHLAASEGHIHLIQYILEMHADINARDRWGSTPLDDAIKFQNRDVAKLLKAAGALRGADVHHGREG